MSAGAPIWKVAAVWLSRLIAGAAFAVAGWAKLVDPRGFVLKISEYLAAWHADGLVPEDIVVIGAVVLSVVELTVGVLLATGCLRRSTAICGLAMMAFMLPLTMYIAIANPVADCGCFGDFLVISNTATLVKNVILTAMLVVCLVFHKAAMPLFRPGLQWLVITLTCVYGLTIAVIGWQFQPVVDFRPYSIGKTLVPEDAEEPQITYIYSRGNEEREFPLDALPDSTWTFVRPASTAATGDELAIFDSEGEDVTFSLLSPDMEGEMLILAVSEPGFDNLVRSRLANELAEYAAAHDITMIGLVAATGEELELWEEMAAPTFDIYSASQTSLQQLVRGATGLVYLRDGRVVWKRNFATISPDFLAKEHPLDEVRVVDDGHVASWLTIFFLAGMLLLYCISALTRINLRPQKASKTL